MNWWSLLAIALALALDAFAVAVVTGIGSVPLTHRRVFRLAFHFGLFQALMPALGWAAGSAVHRWVGSLDHWLAFALLAFVGGRMLWGALRGAEARWAAGDNTRGWSLVMLSVATSLDALAVGISLALVDAPILVPALVIGLVAAALTALGMVVGRWMGALWGRGFEVLGGLILMGMGVRIVLGNGG